MAESRSSKKNSKDGNARKKENENFGRKKKRVFSTFLFPL